ncbi:hypothetical protein [Poseidonibacter lekithochrous]|uniref:hypothetical protein n=1 Tax=Poseidonibacter lekithochrous TaxID=1904463 RepID=UPI0008FC89A9|nr:hypothetical protein [Poseidonibacter lekithochrous]QKJ24203.1 hypothetical protein ALEK_2991 [Poseidonibacter lekithochrous]
MEKELLETTKSLSPIIIALITMGSGIISALITIYLTPKIKFKYEDKKRKIEYQIELIQNIRNMLDTANDFQEIRSSSYWGFIKENLSEREKETVLNKGIVVTVGLQFVKDSDYLTRKSTISSMISRIEKEWGLIK